MGVLLLPGKHRGGIYRYGAMESITADNGWCPINHGACWWDGEGYEMCSFLGKTDPPGSCEFFAGSYKGADGKTVIVCRYNR